MSFYPDTKEHISPTAFANWHEAKPQFVKSYFMGEKGKETAAMRSGKKIHALIEAGLLSVKHRYENAEKTLEVFIDGANGEKFKTLGIPDSYERVMVNDAALFVDYKSGKENSWDNIKLAGDLKMKFTAWLVWNETDKPSIVTGFIEYIPTIWNPVSKEIEPTGGESEEVGKCEYSAEEMEAFTAVILKTIGDINAAYLEWGESTDEFVNQDDVAEFARLAQEIGELESKKDVILERISGQMEFGKRDTIASPFGTFYFVNKKKYAYPDKLAVKVEDETMHLNLTLGETEKIAAVVSAAKKKYETIHAPESVSRSLQFRAKK